MRRLVIIAVILLIALGAIVSMFFTVDETQIAIVSQFGNPVRVLTEPGLKVKLPTPFQSVLRFDKRINVFTSRPSEFLTQDKKNIVVESFACWRILDARKFLQTVKDISGAKLRLGDMIDSELGAALGTVPLSAMISTDAEAIRLEKINSDVLKHCKRKAEQNYGIDVVSVRVRRFNFPEQNKVAVYNRMRSERQRIAKKYRAEGREKAAIIKAETDKEVSRIVSEAYKDAEKVRGEGDAKATKIYAEAYNKDPKFYKWQRTLESYRKFLDEQTTLVLSSDAELMRVLNKGSGQ